jgi:hypothetical protein
MFQRTRQMVVATAAALAVAGMARAEAPASAPSTNVAAQDVPAEIKSLRARLDQLEAQQAEAYRQAQQRETIDQVAADADHRSQLLAEGGGFMAGWDNGFKIRSAEGNFLLHPWFQMQFRNITNFRQDAKQSGQGDDLQNGFELRRMKFGFDGNVFSKDLTYLFLWATDRHDGIPKLEDGWVKYNFADGLYIKAGQIKNPLDHEQLVSSKYQLAVERSLIAGVFVNGDDYVQGVSLIMDRGDAFRAEVAFTDGIRSQNENFQDFPSTTSGNSPKADWGAAGRVEYKVFGDWKDYEHISALGTKKDLFVIGGGADYTEVGHTGILTHVADAQYSTASGLSVYGAFLGRYTARNASAGNSDTYDCTARVFASYLINPKLEPFVQYQYIHFDPKAMPVGTDNLVHDFTVGVNYYFHGQAAKFTVDASYFPNGSPVSDDSSGVLSNNGNNEFLLRAQFQLLL